MTVLFVPPEDPEPWPSLGGEVCADIERYLVHGPGDLRGQPARLDDEKRLFIWRWYEVYPRDHPQAGRRRFRRCVVSLRKGTAKTELAAWIAAMELWGGSHVRCIGWDKEGKPVGGPVTDPYVAMVAYTEDQTEELGYGCLRVVLSEGPLAGDFDIGLDRIMRLDGTGKAEALASSPSSLDGLRVTFAHFDEPHRFTSDRLRAAHATLTANLPKRRAADAWQLETTTCFAPGEDSIAERTMEYARLIDSGKRVADDFFYFHRQAGDHHDLSTEEGIRAAVLEATGPYAWAASIDFIVSLFMDPAGDFAYNERVWLNKPVQHGMQAFDVEKWKTLAQLGYMPAAGALIVLGFDGSRNDDSTALVGTEIETGFQWLPGIWERPYNVKEWEVPQGDVDAAVAAAFERWEVWRMYADPPHWDSWISTWIARHGDKQVIPWHTWRPRPMAFAVRAFTEAIHNGEVKHSGDPVLTTHLGNARKHHTGLVDDHERPLWTLRKESPNSAAKVDASIAAILSWQARLDAIAADVKPKTKPYAGRRLVVAE